MESVKKKAKLDVCVPEVKSVIVDNDSDKDFQSSSNKVKFVHGCQIKKDVIYFFMNSGQRRIQVPKVILRNQTLHLLILFWTFGRAVEFNSKLWGLTLYAWGDSDFSFFLYSWPD